MESSDPRMDPIDITNFFRDRLNSLSKLPKGWKNSDEDDDLDNCEMRIPPSQSFCDRILSLLTQDLTIFKTNYDLPHICPMGEYPGLDLFWMQGLNMRFDEDFDFNGTQILGTYQLTYVTSSQKPIVKTGLMCDLQQSDIDSFLGYLK